MLTGKFKVLKGVPNGAQTVVVFETVGVNPGFRSGSTVRLVLDNATAAQFVSGDDMLVTIDKVAAPQVETAPAK